jgi:hypothetical protein
MAIISEMCDEQYRIVRHCVSRVYKILHSLDSHQLDKRRFQATYQGDLRAWRKSFSDDSWAQSGIERIGELLLR